MNTKVQGAAELQKENAGLRERLDEVEQTLRAIRTGEVDALVVGGQVYSLRGAETPYRMLIEAINEGAAALRLDGTVLYCNDSFARMIGTPLEEIIGLDLLPFVAPPDRVAFDKLLRLGSQHACQGELSLMGPGAQSKRVQITFSPLAVQDTQAVCVVAMDLTERKKAEEALRLAVAYNRSLIEASLDPLVTIGPDGKITDVNAATESATGRSRPELIGTDFSDYFTEPEKARAGYEQVFRDGLVRDYPLELRHSDGHLISVIYNASVYRDAQGSVVGVFAAARDVTVRKKAESALAESERKFRHLFEYSPIGKSLTRVSGEALSNDAFCQMLGYTAEEMAGKKWEDITHPDDVVITRRELASILSGEKREAHFNKRYLHRNGAVVWVEASMVLCRDAVGEPLYFITTPNDITERKRTDEMIRRLNDELEQRVRERTAELETANKELEAFSYSVSHDLRAPLRALDGFSKIALRESAVLSSESKEALQIVRDSAQQMGRLIDDLLMFSRTSRQAVRKQQVSCAALVRECLDVLHLETKDRHVEITTGALPDCSADPGLLKLVWTNLLSNALKFTRLRDPARIEIGHRQDGETVYFVRDNGVGFEMAYADKLFGVFQRLHRAEDFEGTGVGLATTQRIIHRHGGRIWVEAGLNRGATFFFTLGPPNKP